MDYTDQITLVDAELEPYAEELSTVMAAVDDRYAKTEYTVPPVAVDADLSDQERAAGVYRGRADGRASLSVGADDRGPDAFAHELGHDASSQLGLDRAGGSSLVDKTLDELTAYLTQYQARDRTRAELDTEHVLDPFDASKETVFAQVRAAMDPDRLQEQDRLQTELRQAYDQEDRAAIEDLTAELVGTGIGYRTDEDGGRLRPATNMFLEKTAYQQLHQALSALPRMAELETQDDVEALYREAHGMTTFAGQKLKQNVDERLMDHQPYIDAVTERRQEDDWFYPDQDFCCEYLDDVWEQARDAARQDVLDRIDSALQQFRQQADELEGAELRDRVGAVTYGRNADGSQRYDASFDTPHCVGEALAERLYEHDISPAEIAADADRTARLVTDTIDQVYDHWLADGDGPGAVDARVAEFVEEGVADD